MAIEAEVQHTQESVRKDSLPSTNENAELAHVAISVDNGTAKEKVVEKQEEESNVSEFHFSEKVKRNGRLAILFIAIAFLMVGRLSVPDNEVFCIEDKIITAFEAANTFINNPANEFFRDSFQFLCSLMIDIVFIVTFGYWVLYGKSGRLPLSLAIFYVTRALVQKVWFSPFPQGFYWESPGIPSLVVPYGRGSDFFFSGHSGFLVICASEWHKLKFPKVRNYCILTAIYTVLILLTYRIHYSIDIFTGVIFAEWCFTKVDCHKDTVDNYWIYYTSKLKTYLLGKQAQPIKSNVEASPLNP